jgi:hypothetical protein
MLPIALGLQVVCYRVDTSSHVLTQDAKLRREKQFVISTAAITSLVNIGGKIYPCIHAPSCHLRPNAELTALRECFWYEDSRSSWQVSDNKEQV